ncbi:MAG: cyclic pyranopterin monophosphate synthase MoaC [Euryarchaeota archaeon]|nr:cyclic pyranopterin monophosphate synthase MoaC [Euryarchaeota archaeon]
MCARIVDVATKPMVARTARARGRLRLRPSTVEAVKTGRVDKGDVIATARVAALQGVKRTPEWLPLCHSIPVTSAETDFVLEADGIVLEVTVGAHYRTGVEMEALTGTVAGLLCVWDMVKPLEKDDTGGYPDARLEDVRVVEKTKGAA